MINETAPIEHWPQTSGMDAALQRAIASMSLPRIAVLHRLIADGDEAALLPEELPAFVGSVAKVRRASGAARIVARQLMSRFGRAAQAIRKSTTGAPIWPEGLVGSLAHDDRIAVAALAERSHFENVGIDVEPAEPIDPDLMDLIATPAEQAQELAGLYCGRLLFAIKEAVYKAVHPSAGRFLDYHDVEVNLSEGVAQVRGRYAVHFRHCDAMHVVVLAYIRSG
jgi:4'-phosphopantetheinyl transferase EntD